MGNLFFLDLGKVVLAHACQPARIDKAMLLEADRLKAQSQLATIFRTLAEDGSAQFEAL